MEMTAVIEGLSALKRPCEVTLYLDSEYVRKGITEWIHGWKARGWRTAAKQPVKNADLWQKLDAVVSSSGHRIEWRWVKGHNGDPGNERADALANQGVDKALGRRSGFWGLDGLLSKRLDLSVAAVTFWAMVPTNP